MSFLLIYMPAFNEAETIASVIKSIPKEVGGFDKVKILVVNDGSTDETKNEAQKVGAIVISHNRNKGVGAAFHSALNYALKNKVDVLLSIDADGQFDVKEIGGMVAPILAEESDFCIGSRFANGKPEKMSKIKYWGNNRVNAIISLICGQKINDASCGFRAYSKESLLQLNLQGSFTYTHETILDLLNKGLEVKQIPVTVTYFEERVSRVANNILNYTIRTLKIIIKSLKDYMPFYFFMSIAIVILLMAIICGGFVGIHWVVNGVITPYKSIGIFSLALLGISVILITLALVADMMGRLRKNQEKILYLLKKERFE